ncbi:MAG: hypothetical protein RMJ67_04045 [Elusimicrobiota bacterium]|nr:hypothetical protein [Endomicrobiia bacterium]MDW8165663.1 hypothetical protein [Elusimicrobiota bacterium]
MELKKEVKTINVFLTPLAAFLIICAVLISNADTVAAAAGLLIVLFTIFFNNLTALLKEPSLVVVILRVIINLLLNLVLVYIFIPFWTPIWLLLMLSCLGTAVYSDFVKTFLISLVSAVALVIIFYLRVVPNLVSGYTKLIRVGEIVNYALFIIIVSILVNGIVRKYKSMF